MNRKRLLLILPLLVCLVIGITLLLNPRDRRATPVVVDTAYPVAMPERLRELPLPARLGGAATGEAAHSSEIPVESIAAPVVSAEETSAESLEAVLRLRVVESGSNVPLPGAVVSLAPLESAAWRDEVTSDHGAVTFGALEPGDYSASVVWSGVTWSPSAPVHFGGGDVERELRFPARDVFPFQLVDEEGEPLPRVELRGRFDPENRSQAVLAGLPLITSDDQGRFTLRGYAGTNGLMLHSHDPVMFRFGWEPVSETQPRSWSNPLWMPARHFTRSGEITRVTMRAAPVAAVGRLVGVTPGVEERFATIVGNHIDLETRFDESDRVTFMAFPGDVVVIRVRRHAEIATMDANAEGILAWREFVHVQRMPTESGAFEFDINAPERGDGEALSVSGRLLGPGDEPVAGVVMQMILRGSFPQDLEVPPPARVLTRSGWRSIMTTEPTNARGEFTATAPAGEEFLILPTPATMPEGMFLRHMERIRFDPANVGREIVLRLGHCDLIWGEVIDARGNPVAGARLRLSGWGPQRNILSPQSTNADGIFELNIASDPQFEPSTMRQHGLPQIYVLATTADGRIGWAETTINQQTPTRVVLLPSTRVVLTVRQPGTIVRSVFARARFGAREVQQASWKSETRQFRSDNGVFDLGSWPRGITRLEVTLPGGTWRFVDVPSDAGDVLRITVE